MIIIHLRITYLHQADQVLMTLLRPTHSYTLTYCTVHNTYTVINKLGQGALFSKIGLKNAFRLIPVWQEDWNLLSIYWKSKY